MALEVLVSRIYLVAVGPVARELFGGPFPAGTLVGGRVRAQAWSWTRRLLLGRHVISDIAESPFLACVE